MSTVAVEVYSDMSPAQNELGAVKYQCSFIENYSIFSYKLIEDKIDDNLFRAPIIDQQNQYIYFSFCNDSNITCSNLTPQDVRGSAIMADATDEDNLVCTRVSSDNWNDVNITYVESPLDRTRDFLRLSWNGIDSCPNYPDEKWRFSIDVVCSDIAIEDSRFFYIGGFDDDTCKIRTQFESKLGCAIVSFSQIWTYLNNNLTIFAIILIVVGVFLCLAGYRILIVTMFIAGFLATVVVLLIVVVQFIITPNTAQYVFWI